MSCAALVIIIIIVSIIIYNVTIRRCVCHYRMALWFSAQRFGIARNTLRPCCINQSDPAPPVTRSYLFIFQFDFSGRPYVLLAIVYGWLIVVLVLAMIIRNFVSYIVDCQT